MGFKGKRGGGECGFGKGAGYRWEMFHCDQNRKKVLISLTGNSFVVTSCSKTAPHVWLTISVPLFSMCKLMKWTGNRPWIYTTLFLYHLYWQQKQRQHFWTKGQTQKNRDWSKRAASVHAQITSKASSVGLHAHSLHTFQCSYSVDTDE